MELLMNFSDPHTWLFCITAITGMGTILFANSGKVFLGVFILLINALIIQTNEEKASNIRFVYEQFKQGHSIECGLWRGRLTLADPTKGWVLEQGRFIKDDTVLSDPYLCNVVDRDFPQTNGIISLLFFLFMTGLALLARVGIREQEGIGYWSGEKKSVVPDIEGEQDAD